MLICKKSCQINVEGWKSPTGFCFVIELHQQASHQEVSEPGGRNGETSCCCVCWTSGGQREGEVRSPIIFLWVCVKETE